MFDSSTGLRTLSLVVGMLLPMMDSLGQVPVLNPRNGHSYLAAPGVKSWEQAKSAAEAQGGHLVTVTTADEANFIAAQFPAACNNGYWLGGTQAARQPEPSAGWSWVTGEPWAYTNWLPGGEPNDSGGVDERFLALHGYLGTNPKAYWNDVQPFNTPGYVVEFPEPATVEDKEFSVRIPVPPGWTLLTASAANLALVPEIRVSAGGAGEALITTTPRVNQSGKTTIILSFRQPSGAMSTSIFSLSVKPINDPPKITPIGDLNTNEDTPLPPVALTVGDEEDLPEQLKVTASSSLPGLFPDGNIVLGGSGSSRTLTLVPAEDQFGKATITVKVTDAEGASSVIQFVVTVNSVNDHPTISVIREQTIDEDTSTGIIPVTVNDAETSAADLILTAESSRKDVIPDSGIVLGGSGADRTIRFTPLPNAHGTCDIRVSVTDANGVDNNATIKLTVRPINDWPTINLPREVSAEPGKELTIPFTLSDQETPPEQLLVTAGTSDPAVVWPENIKITLPQPPQPTVWKVDITPNGIGKSTITITVRDPEGGVATGQTLLNVRTLPGVSISDATIVEDLHESWGETDGLRFYLKLTEPVEHDVTVTVTTLSGPLSEGTATANIDYIPRTDVIVIAKGQRFGWTEPVKILPDGLEEGGGGLHIMGFLGDTARVKTENFEVRIISVNGARIIKAPGFNLLDLEYREGVASGYIIDNDDPSNNGSPFSLPDAAINEDTSSLPFRLPSVAELWGLSFDPWSDLKVVTSEHELVGDQGIVWGGSPDDRTITVTPRPNASGEGKIVIVWNAGGAEVPVMHFKLIVQPVNDPPKFIMSARETVMAVEGDNRVVNFVTDVIPGPSDENGQSVNFRVVAHKPDLFFRQPAISTDGTLTYTPAPGASGSPTVSVTAVDDGGTANGGKDSSEPRTFTILLREPVPPSLGIQYLPNEEIRVQWTDPESKYHLETTPTTEPDSWASLVLENIVREGEKSTLQFSADGRGAFFRLRKTTPLAAGAQKAAAEVISKQNVPAGANVLVWGPVTPGTSVVEEVPTTPLPVVLTVPQSEGNYYVIFVDPTPGRKFSHPTTVTWLNLTGGESSKKDTQWTVHVVEPGKDPTAQHEISSTVIGKADVAHVTGGGTVIRPEPRRAADSPVTATGSGCRKLALVVDGGDRETKRNSLADVMAGDADAFGAWLEGNQFQVERRSQASSSSAPFFPAAPPGVARSLLERIRQIGSTEFSCDPAPGCCHEFFLWLGAHGGSRGLSVYGASGNGEVSLLLYEELFDSLARFPPCVKIIVFVDACSAGAAQEFIPRLCRDRPCGATIVAAVDINSIAPGGLDFGEDSATQDFLEYKASFDWDDDGKSGDFGDRWLHMKSEGGNIVPKPAVCPGQGKLCSTD